MEAGTICFAISVLSVFGLFAFAFILERFKSYKTTTMWIFRIQGLAFILFSLSLESKSFLVMCVSSSMLGWVLFNRSSFNYLLNRRLRIFMVGFQLVGQELAVELTFDTVREDISLGVINVLGFFLGILVTIIVKKLQETFSILFGNLCFSLLIMLSTMIMSLVKSSELKRLEVTNFIDSAVASNL